MNVNIGNKVKITKTELLKVAKPISFSTEIVKAILDGRKTQTRRVVPFNIYLDESGLIKAYSDVKNMRSLKGTLDSVLAKSKYKIGDILWVREPVKTIQTISRAMGSNIALKYKYLSDGATNWVDIPERIKKNSSNWYLEKGRGIPNGCIKEMARTFLKIINVRVERLQDISDEDCIAEGILKVSKDGELFKYCIYDKKDYSSTPWQEMPKTPQKAYASIWNKTAPKGYKWEDNPYVFVYEFEVVAYR